MEYLEFLEQLKKQIQKKLGGEVKVSIGSVMKNNNNQIETLSIMGRDENLVPAIHVAPLYQEYQSGTDIEELADGLVDFFHNQFHGGNVDMSFYSEFENVKRQIAFRLINYENNKAMLEMIPHKKYLDLAIVYYCRVEHELFGKGSILIHNSHMEMWNTNLEVLHDTALSNTMRLLPCECVSLEDLLSELTGVSMEEDTGFPVYVLTNTEKYFGAAAVLYDAILERLGEKLQGNYFVIPSSIHECLILPDVPETNSQDLYKLVHEVNTEHVLPGDVLSDSVYYYHRGSRRLMMAEKKSV